jgi:hypothetical protein
MARSQARWSAATHSAYSSSSSSPRPRLPGPDTWTPSCANGYDTGSIFARDVRGVHHAGWLVTVRLLVVLVLASAAIGQAADEVVGDCSTDAELRTKLASMQSGEGGTLTFACGASSVIELTGGVLPEIFRETTIDGGGAITLNGSAHRILQVDVSGSLTLKHINLTNAVSGTGGAAVINSGALALEDVEISNSATGPLGRGGAIYTTPSSNLTIADSRLFGNSAGSGGAIFADNTFAPLTITNSVLSDNIAFGDEATTGWGGAILLLGSEASIEGGEIHDNEARTGGAIVAWELSTLVINRTVIFDNRALNGPGGGLRLGEGPGSNVSAALTDVTLDGNTAEGGALAFPTGGGIHCDGCSLEIDRSTLAANSATNRGGGLYLTSPLAPSKLVNVTIAGNEGGSFGGGGMYLDNGSIDLTNVTLVSNSAAPGSGGGIASFNGSVGLRNVVLVNSNDNCHFVSPVGTPVKDSNLSSDGSCSFGSSRDDVTIPNIVLRDNGGPTRTVMFDADGPTVDRGTPNGCPPTDQRGAPRPFGASCDVGATEFGAEVPTTTTTTTTLPAACGPACVTTDPCRPKACVQDSCVTQDVGALAGATCVCQRSTPSVCGNLVPPPKVLKPAAKACELLNAAAAASPGRRRLKKLKKARVKWQAATRLVGTRATRRVLTTECITALAADYDDAASRVGTALQAGGQ